MVLRQEWKNIQTGQGFGIPDPRSNICVRTISFGSSPRTEFSVAEDSQKHHSQRTVPSSGGLLRFRSESRNNKLCRTGKLVGNSSGIYWITTQRPVRDVHPTTTAYYCCVVSFNQVGIW